MTTTLKELIEGNEVSVDDTKLHRGSKVIERPTEEVLLERLYSENKEYVKTQLDPTDDLVQIPYGTEQEDIEEFLCSHATPICYYIFDKNTGEVWVAPDKKCLDANFIYREDLIIHEAGAIEEIAQWLIAQRLCRNYPEMPRKTCYILDNPANETYEVYYETAYPSRVYGKATPQGCFIHKYQDRFHRDMAILELDKMYAQSSKKQAEKLTKKKLAKDEAIIISDGCWMKNVCAYSIVYIDNANLTKSTSGYVPSEEEQAVLIAEIKGAYEALKMCYQKKKTKITYHYDNTSILNVFRNRKTEYLPEVAAYKKLVEKMHNEGFEITFVEVHPKTGEEKDKDNKAIAFFHNGCDAACREMADVFKRDYSAYVISDAKPGTTYSKFQQSNKPKGTPRNNGNRGKRV